MKMLLRMNRISLSLMQNKIKKINSIKQYKTSSLFELIQITKNTNNSSKMENLPPIAEMYSSIRQNKDYNVIKKYEDLSKTQIMKKAITKKGHYLDDQVKYSCSPGPANQSNLIQSWSLKTIRQHKYGDRKTQVDQIQTHSKKYNFPSPDKYTLTMPWPKQQEKAKAMVSEKTNFVNSCQFYSDKIPGPGSYMIATRIAKEKKQGKILPNHPLKASESIKADMGTYNPCPADFNTFMKYSIMPQQQKTLDKSKSTESLNKSTKKDSLPGPGQYQVVHTWRGKDPLKKNELSYLNSITKGPALNIYHN